MNEPFRLENALTITDEFLYDNFSKKILLIFLLKLSYRKSLVQFDILIQFQNETVSLFFFLKEVLKSERVDIIIRV